MKSAFLCIVFVCSTACLAAVATPSPQSVPSLSKSEATAAFSWSEGAITYSTITNAISIIQGTPYLEKGMGTYVGFYADPNAGQPAPNVAYYVHVVVAGIGNAVSGMRAFIDIALPPGTSLAISTANPINYYYDNKPLPVNESPQSLSASSYNAGAYQILSVDAANAYTWPIPQGKTLEIQIPVISTSPLTNSILQANVWALDGNSSPWLRPQVGVFVFNTQPTIFYSAPSTISITQTSGRSQATVYTGGIAGTGYFDLGTTTSYGLIRDPVTISTGNNSWLVWDEWGPPALTPGTVYHWRFTFTTGGVTYYGTDQTFTTLPAPVSVSRIETEIRRNEGLAASRSFDLQGRMISLDGATVAQKEGRAGLKIRVSPGAALKKVAIPAR